MNENDTISVTELMFTDNDELSGMVAAMMNAQVLIILSNVDGIYNGMPGDPETEVIREVYPEKKDLSKFIQTTRSSFGRGGMLTKYHIARKVADEGIEVIIANGKTDHILTEVLKEDSDIVCTRFFPSEKGVSNMKKWIAHSEGFAKGEIHINKCAREALWGENATSLLSVGITDVKGEFEKDDIVRIFDEEGTQIGVGRVSYDKIKVVELMGKKGNKPVIHYDYLYLE
jgi:glutamate 5-kinase